MSHKIIAILCLSLGLLSCEDVSQKEGSAMDEKLSRAQVQTIAKESYIALFPLVYNYGTMYNQAIDEEAPEYVGGFGVYKHYGLATPENRDIPTPNNNTPYSWAWVDLREEPWVLTMPEADGNRYYVCQWDDMWGYVIDAPGSIIDGQQGGSYLLATTDFKEEVPEGIKRIIYSESDFAGTLTRTGVNGEADIPLMEAIQKGYVLQPLSAYLGAEAPAKAEEVKWIPYRAEALKTIEFFKYANFMLSFTKANEADVEMLEKASRIGIAAGKDWDVTQMDSTRIADIEMGIQQALEAIDQQVAITADGKKLFNTRQVIGEDYLNRTVGVVVGQFGNYPSQAMYPGFNRDSEGRPLDGSKANYTVRFPKGEAPKSDYFWSFTMYDLPNRFLVDNPIDRYSIGSQTESLTFEEDGSLVIYFQTDSPGKEKEGNWLPTPDAPFYSVLRIYGPGEEVLNGTYQLPKMIATPRE